MSNYIGDHDTSSRIDFDYTFTDTTGLATALTSGSACVRRLDSGTAAAGQVAQVGGPVITSSGALNHFTIFTGSETTFFASGKDYHVFMAAGTVSGVSVASYPIGHFSLRNRAALYPTTAGRTLVVDSNGRVDLALWLGSAPNALIAGRVDANTQVIAAGAISSSQVAASANNAIADAVLNRDLATGASVTTRNVQNALRVLRNKTDISGSSNPYTFTCFAEDDSTTAWTASLTFSANTFGVSTLDPP